MINRVGAKIRQLRLLAGLSQENVAEEIGMSHGNFGKIERGEIDINTNHLFAVAKALKVDVTELFEFDSKPSIKGSQKDYGYATKADIDELSDALQSLNKTIDTIKLQLSLSKQKETAAEKKGNKKSK